MQLNSLATGLLAVAVIVSVAQLLGALANRWGQPRVIGEIVGGIVLGPSLLGSLAPGLEQTLFSPTVVGRIDLMGQLGLVLFMFLVGLDLNPGLLRGRLPLAGRITLVGVLLPLVLGVSLAIGLEAWQPRLLKGDNSLDGALFMGTAMAITAFPVLVRILKSRGLQHLPLGTIALSAAAIDDVLGWCLLAAVVALHSSGSALSTLPLLLQVALWSVVLLVATAPLRRLLQRRQRAEQPLGPLLESLILAGALFSAVVTELLGVHAIFGAFLWGLAMPRNARLQESLELRLEAVLLRLLLPLFFAVSGLQTRLGSLSSPQLWLAALLVLLVAVMGKFGGTWLMARLSGVPQREALALGWLMNTRGLTELVVLNVGYDLGVLSDELFTMGVLMALITTAMAGPLLDRLGYRQTAGL